MNARMFCPGVAGTACSCRGVVFDDAGIRIDEIRFGHTAHLLFICGKPIAKFLEGAVLECEDGQRVELRGTPQLRIACRSWEIPYRLTNVFFAAKEQNEKRA